LISLKFWSLVCVCAFVIGAWDLLSVGIGSCSNRAVTRLDQILMVGSALAFVVSVAGILVCGFMKLASAVKSRTNDAASENAGLENPS
jgi:hypothetical protein